MKRASAEFAGLARASRRQAVELPEFRSLPRHGM
jgi:hypothetical protein